MELRLAFHLAGHPRSRRRDDGAVTASALNGSPVRLKYFQGLQEVVWVA